MACDAPRLAVWCCLALGIVSLHAAQALADEPLRVLVRVVSADDRALLPRLYGQLSDVNVRLVTLESAALEATFAQQLRAADALAQQHVVDAVLWFATIQPEPDAKVSAIWVHVVTRADQHVLTRRLVAAASGAPEEKLASSLLETAALATRSALIAITAGSHVGIPTRQALAEADSAVLAGLENAQAQEPGSAPEAPTASPVPETPSHSPAAAPNPEPQPSAAKAQPIAPAPSALSTLSSVRATDVPEAQLERDGAPTSLDFPMFIGVQGTLDGRSSVGQHSFYAKAGLGVGSVVVSVYGAASLASTIDDAYFDLRVARHAVGLALELRSTLSGATQVGLGLHAGAALFQRSSRSKSAEAVSYPSSLTAALAFGPEVALRWIFFGRYGLGVRLGLDVLPNAPAFETGPRPMGGTISHSLWALQPRLALGMEAALP